MRSPFAAPSASSISASSTSCITVQITSRSPSGFESKMFLTAALAVLPSVFGHGAVPSRESGDVQHHQPAMTASLSAEPSAHYPASLRIRGGGTASEPGKSLGIEYPPSTDRRWRYTPQSDEQRRSEWHGHWPTPPTKRRSRAPWPALGARQPFGLDEPGQGAQGRRLFAK